MVALILMARGRAGQVEPAHEAAAAPPVAWRQRLIWIGLSAATSSLLLGGHRSTITQDVASAPFLWVIPLALYLLSFVIAFQAQAA